MLSSSATSAAKFPELYRELLHVDPAKRKRNIEATFDVGVFVTICPVKIVDYISHHR